MDKFIEAIANGNFEAILSLVTAILSSGFGTALVIVATKFLHYKKSVKDTVNEVNSKLVPQIEEMMKNLKIEVIDEMKADFKVIAESIALSTSDTSTSKIGVIENVSKIGVSKQVQEQAIKVVEEEVKANEEKKEELNQPLQTKSIKEQ